MKVLHLPTNIASQMRVTVAALCEMGIEARGLTGRSPVQNATGLEILPYASPHDSFLKRKAIALRRAALIMKAITRADIVHWHYSAEPAIPAAATTRPLVVHAPSAPGAKGTKFILAAVEKLRAERDFDFQLVHGRTPLEAKESMRRCDIFVDQLIGGEYGVAAVETMALGKPVISFMKPSLLPHYSAHFPVISANPDTVESVLRALLRDGPRRHAAGAASRAWAEERHDARKVVARIAEYSQAA